MTMRSNETKARSGISARVVRPQWLRPLISVIVIAVLWQVLAEYVIKSDLVFAPLTAILARAAELVVAGKLWLDLRVSAAEFFLGYGAAVVFGILLGVALALSRALHNISGRS
jgi:ABC-type nitrate/sulfonate/bicarbonate transport system permease component